MNSCEFIAMISALACSIAKGKSPEEIALLGSFFSALGESLDAIAAHKVACAAKEDTD